MQQILRLISGDFLRLIGLAKLLAAPITWYLSTDWLAQFAYRIDFPWWGIFLSGSMVMVVAFLTISTQSLRAAWSNPVDAIRDD